jgi:hypothetical protein
MPRRPATITQADVARAIRAARQTGVTKVEITPGGSILFDLAPTSAPSTAVDLEPEKEIIL